MRIGDDVSLVVPRDEIRAEGGKKRDDGDGGDDDGAEDGATP
jgi:hypothetical protein